MARVPIGQERKHSIPLDLTYLSGRYKHYVYRHIRLDKHEPFYIGVGSIYDGSTNRYQRARDKKGRSGLWNNIVNKHSYKIEIIFESDDYEEILKKEIEFINLYGRINNKTGILANLTDGGEGVLGVIYSEEHKNQARIKSTGKKVSKETVLKMSEAQKARGHKSSLNCRSKPVFQYSIEGVYLKKWYCSMDIERDLNIGNSRIGKALKKENHYAAGFYWYSQHQGDTCPIYKVIGRPKIAQIDIEGNVITVFKGVAEVARTLFESVNRRSAINSISDVCKGKKSVYKNLIFRYHD